MFRSQRRILQAQAPSILESMKIAAETLAILDPGQARGADLFFGDFCGEMERRAAFDRA